MVLTKQQSHWGAICAAQALIAVAAGAFGAHGLKAIVAPQNLEWWQTGCQYLMYHALAGLIMVCATHWHDKFLTAAKFFVTGSVLFSGSLLVMTITDIRLLGALTPIGGLIYLMGWGLAVYNFVKSSNKEAN